MDGVALVMGRAAAGHRAGSGVPQTRPLGGAAEAFEAVFYGEMLRHAGFGEAPKGLGHARSEDHFSVFLVRAVAEELARTRPLGIGEAVIDALGEEGLR